MELFWRFFYCHGHINNTEPGLHDECQGMNPASKGPRLRVWWGGPSRSRIFWHRPPPMNKGASKRISGGLDQWHRYDSGESYIYLSYCIVTCRTNCIAWSVPFFASPGGCNPVVGRIVGDPPRICSIHTKGMYLIYKESPNGNTIIRFVTPTPMLDRVEN